MKSKPLFIVMKKELLNIIRDTKTLAFSILIPLLLIPVLFYLIGFAVNRTEGQVKNNFTVAIQGNTDSDLAKNIQSSLNAEFIHGDVKENVASGKALVGIVIPDDFGKNIDEGKTSNLQVYYDDSSQGSMSAESRLSSVLQSYSRAIVEERLIEKGLDPNIINPISKETLVASVASEDKESGGFSKFMLGLLLPLLLVVYAATSPISSATDMAAGEKERGTLEPLLTTRASRMSLLWGKYFTIIIMSIITILASLVGVVISFNMKGGFLRSEGMISIPPLNILLIGIFSIATTMVFGAIELSLSIYARSYKEAQTYLTPITLIVMIPAYATYMLDPKSIDTFFFFIPVANIVCIIKELVAGILIYSHIGITMGWCIIYIIASILWAKYMFNSEKVLFRS